MTGQTWVGLVRFNRTRAAALAGALAMATGSAMAADRHPPVAPVSIEAARCTALMDQFTRAAQPERVDDTARSIATQGMALCRHGRVVEGADTLAQAVRLIGRVPAEPTQPTAYQAHN